MFNRIDTHIHAIPETYVEAVDDAGGDPSGFPWPTWSFDATLQLMNKIGISIAILSISAPGVSITGPGEVGRSLARYLNNYFGEHTVNRFDNRLGFFGVLPDWQDVEGTIREIDYLYEQQRLCFGITLFTTYGGRLLGDPLFKPIWQRLQAHKALVFLHPTVMEISPMYIASVVPQPVLDFPLATTRTAVDLILSGTLQACPDVDVILSHAGGTLPFIADRVTTTIQVPSVAELLPVDAASVKADFARFYLDIALSAGSTQLSGLLDFADPSHVLFGSDFPFCPEKTIENLAESYSGFVEANPRGWMIAPDVLRSNAAALLKKHAQNQTINWDFDMSEMAS